MITKRDNFIDFFKGMLILWVIHIHTVFLSGELYIPEIVRQISLLVDVPVFFFISGYLTKPLNFTSSAKKAAKQFTNLYLNYCIVSCIILLPLSIYSILYLKTIPNIQMAVFSMMKMNLKGSLWNISPVYISILWYIKAYLSLLLFVPPLISFFNSRYSRLIILVSLLLIFSFSEYLNWNHNFLFSQTLYVNCYLLIYMLGAAYKIDEQNIRTKYLALTFLLNVILCSIIFHLDGDQLIIQAYKFPPSLKYLMYSLLLIHIFAIAKRIWSYANSAPSNKIFHALEWCGKNSYFIYLFQAVACAMAFYVVAILNNHVPALALYCIVITFNLSFTLLITFIYTRLRTAYLKSVKSVKVIMTKKGIL